MPSLAVRRAQAAALETRPVGPRVLLINKREWTCQNLSAALPAAGYVVHQVPNGREAQWSILSIRPDLILLHLGSPNMDGTEVIRHLRERPTAPIIVISVRREENEEVSSLDAGAHDYLAQPFSVPALLARMRAALRSVNATNDDIFAVGNLRVNLVRRQVFVDEAPVRLTATEYDLLKVLINHAGTVRAHRQLIHELWGGTQYQDPVHLLRVTLSHLRGKLQSDRIGPPFIMTEPGVGYRLRTESAA